MSTPTSIKKKPVVEFLALIIILGLCAVMGRSVEIDVEYLRRTLFSFPLLLSAAIFIALYVSITFLVWFGAKDVFRISSAIVFGGELSALLVWLAESVNSFVLFSLSRKLGREYIVRKLRLSEEDIARARRDSSVLGIVALRINPLVPVRLLDLAYGLTSIPFRKYFFATFFVTFFRVYWMQSIIAGVGRNILKEPEALFQYLMQNQEIVLYSGGYILAVVVVTIAAVFRRQKQPQP